MQLLEFCIYMWRAILLARWGLKLTLSALVEGSGAATVKNTENNAMIRAMLFTYFH